MCSMIQTRCRTKVRRRVARGLGVAGGEGEAAEMRGLETFSDQGCPSFRSYTTDSVRTYLWVKLGSRRPCGRA